MKILRYAAIAAIALTAAPAAATTFPFPPTALLNKTGTLSLDSSGLEIKGVLDAQYRLPPPGSRPYVFSTSLRVGPLTLTPSLTITTPEVVISQGTPQIGVCPLCIPATPPVILPAQALTITPTLPVASLGTVYDASFQSQPVPAGDVLGFDFGSQLLGTPLSLNDLVQDQFETGATTVSVAGGIGPFGATFDYDGELQPGGEQILAHISATLTGPGILSQLEDFALGLINDNIDVLGTLAFDLFLQNNNLCAQFGPLAGTCNNLLAGLDPTFFGLQVNSFGTLTAGYEWEKSIVPIPLPAAGWLMLAGLGGLGVAARRRRRAA